MQKENRPKGQSSGYLSREGKSGGGFQVAETCV